MHLFWPKLVLLYAVIMQKYDIIFWDCVCVWDYLVCYRICRKVKLFLRQQFPFEDRKCWPNQMCCMESAKNLKEINNNCHTSSLHYNISHVVRFGTMEYVLIVHLRVKFCQSYEVSETFIFLININTQTDLFFSKCSKNIQLRLARFEGLANWMRPGDIDWVCY